MRLSVIIGTHNEWDYIPSLLQRMVQYKQECEFEFEIIVVDDASDHPVVLDAFSTYAADISVKHHSVNGNFGHHKTYMNSLATAPWILNLDADEYISVDLFSILPSLMDNTFDAYAFPRVNLVEGMTLDYARTWGCSITSNSVLRSTYPRPVPPDEYALWRHHNLILEETPAHITILYPLIAWPDYQYRLYKNTPSISWVNKVHEKLTGFSNLGVLPDEIEYAIWHPKTLTRQVSQNTFYTTIGE